MRMPGRILGSALLAVVLAAATAVSPAGPVAASTAIDVPHPVVEGPVPATAPPGDPSRDYPFLATPIDLAARGYVEEEFFLSSTEARRYSGVGLTTATPGAANNAFKTRIIVRRPALPAQFNGVVLLEWQNVTALYDIDHYWLESSDHIMRSGYAWVGVSAQRAGVHPVLPGACLPAVPATWSLCNNLRTWSPARYGSLNIPTDDVSYDIFAMAAKAVRSPAADQPAPLGDLRPHTVIAIGTSQSAGRLALYHNSIHPLQADPVIDAFFLGEGRGALRTDLDVPVLRLLSEVDVRADFAPPDAPNYRHWEVAGASHADFGFTSKIQPLIARDGILQTPQTCARPAPSRIPKRYTYHAAWDHLVRWVADGTPPPVAPRIRFDGSQIARDADGNALGGIRLSEHAVPTAYNGTGNSGGGFCVLFGVHEPFSPARLAELYRNHGAYVSAVARVNNDNRRAGLLVAADAAESTAAAAAFPVGRR